jgi:hypothetical protein
VRGAHEEESVGDDTEGTQHHRIIREGCGDFAVDARWYHKMEYKMEHANARGGG